MTRDETTCIKDTQTPIAFKIGMMFCYEPNFEYVQISQCESRNPNAKCKAFESIKDFREKELAEQ